MVKHTTDNNRQITPITKILNKRLSVNACLKDG